MRQFLSGKGRRAVLIKKPNFIIIGIVCIFVIVEILFLRPSNVESTEETATSMFNSIESMLQAQKLKDDVGYTIEGFHYTAVEGGLKHWEMQATVAVLFEKSRLVQAQKARIKMFDATGKITYIEGDEAHYLMNNRDLDLIGNVMVTFPDGFWLKTTKAHYSASTGVITSDEFFNGEANPQKDEIMQVWGKGFEASKFGPDINVLSQARVKLRRIDQEEITEVNSDRARLDRFGRMAYFSMFDSTRAVTSYQGTLHVRSKRQDATYDPDSKALRYMTAYDDVLIKETDPIRGKNGLKYATSQKAEFMTRENKILLSGFPSAYQEHDTLTGELITIYRNTNMVEVTHANAYHEGTTEQKIGSPEAR